MNETRSERASRVIKEVMFYLHIDSITTFAKEIGISYMKVYYTINGTNNGISEELADKIVEYCPTINRDYLVKGTGTLTSNEELPVEEEHTSVTPNDLVALLDRITALFERVQAAEDRLRERERMLDEREAEILKLLSKRDICPNSYTA